MAVGPESAPILFVMLCEPSPRMLGWLWATIRDCGIRKSDVRTVYLLDSPPEGAYGRPTKAQLRANWPRIVDEIQCSEPRVVVPFGGDALWVTTGMRADINDARGAVIPSTLRGRVTTDVWKQIAQYKTNNKKKGYKIGDPRFKWVKEDGDPIEPQCQHVTIPSLTLDYIRTDAFAATSGFKHDMDRVYRAMHGELALVDDEFVYETALTGYPGSNDYFDDVIAIDIETPPNLMVIDRVSISNGQRTYTLPWTEHTRVWLQREVRRAYERKAILVFHNGAFDIPRLRRAGCHIPEDARVYDTMLAGVLLQPDMPKGLGKMATLLLDVIPWKKDWEKWLGVDEERYSAKDAFVTARLALAQMPLLKELGMWDLFMGGPSYPGPGLMATIQTLMDATEAGLKLDKFWARIWAKKLRRRLLIFHTRWAQQFAHVNPGSTKDLRNLLYREWKLPVPKKTDDAIVSTDELALIKLKRYVEANPDQLTDARCTPGVFDLLLDIRGAGKDLKTYATPVLVSADAYIHPSYLPEAKDRETRDGAKRKGNTATGRLAASYPNIANQPKHARRMYIPDHPDWCFVQADYKSAELYVLAYLSGDKTLQDDLASDIHTRNALRLKTDRRTAKNVLYASLYLAGPTKVSDMILRQQHFYIEPAECERVQRGLKEVYAVSEAYKRMLMDTIMPQDGFRTTTQPYLVNPFGRIRFFYDRNVPAAVNFPNQSTVADMLLCVLKPVADALKRLGGRLTTTVYDSILGQVPQEVVPAAAIEMRNIMERRFPQVAPNFYIPVSFEVAPPGKSWAEVSDYAVA